MTEVSLFQESTAIDSLRNNDFDTVTAYGEVVDNSIEAGAKNVKIQFRVQHGRYGFESIECVAFGDDGEGMNDETLHRCLQLGWSSRYNKRDGIGRFGVGMTLAAIHECKRIEIYSNYSRNEWKYTYVDIDEITKGQMKSIPIPIMRKPPNEYHDLIDIDGHGTLVIWSKYDRQLENASKLREDSKVWMGRTYRYFIWNGVSIFIDGEDVKAIDPLFIRTERTKFPSDPTAEEYKDIVFDWPVDDFDAPPGHPENSEIRIKMSLLPEHFRMKRGAGGSSLMLERYIPDNEGISILRNKREVYYGKIPHWKAAGLGWPIFEDLVNSG